MSLTLIEDLAYTLKKGKEDGKRAIVFLGAGASKTGGIPLAGELMTEILKRYADVPAVKRLSPDDKTSYTKVMAALGPVDRKALFKEYIDKANINASHIYLAHMMKEGFIDFVFTVNFDNLMQRALGLFNMYPAVYDMAMLKGMTTAPFESPGLVYLHGQYHGFNLLNTEHEFESVRKLLERCFISVANRPWIMVGYSGEDPVLDYINALGRFEHGLYWVCYKDRDPSDRVSDCFFSTNDKNTFKLKGCDADSFFVKLHAELGIPQPPIIDTPFSYLKGLQESITDIDGDDLKKANERLNITKNWISQAITTYEQPGAATTPDKDKIEVEKMHKNLIDIIITEKYELLSEFNEHYVDPSLKEDLAIGYYNWGISLYNLGKASTGTEAVTYFKQGIEKFQQSLILKPDDADTYNAWGNSLGSLGLASTGTVAVTYFKQSVEKFEQALSHKPHDAGTYYTWGLSLYNLGRASTGVDAIIYFKQAIEKFEQALSLKPENAAAYSTWGLSLNNLGQSSTGADAITYFKQAIEKYEHAIRLKPDDADTYSYWGSSLHNLGQVSNGTAAIAYFKQAIEKYEQAVHLEPGNAVDYYNWGNSLDYLGRALIGTEAKACFKQAIVKYEQSIRLKPDYAIVYNNYCSTLLNLSYLSSDDEKTDVMAQALSMAEKVYVLAGESYNLSCCYALLNDTTNAFKYLEEALQNDKIKFLYVSEDKDWDHLRTHPEYLRLKERYNKTF